MLVDEYEELKIILKERDGKLRLRDQDLDLLKDQLVKQKDEGDMVIEEKQQILERYIQEKAEVQDKLDEIDKKLQDKEEEHHLVLKELDSRQVSLDELKALHEEEV